MTSLLREKPSDPVPFIYNYLCQVRGGVEKPKPITNIQIAQVKNLRLKIADLQSKLGAP